MSLDLNQMSRKDLLQLRKDVEKALKDAEQRERTEALKAAEQAAAEYGFSLDEVLSPNMPTRASCQPRPSPERNQSRLASIKTDGARSFARVRGSS